MWSKIGEVELTVISDLLKPTDDTTFTPSMINERPIELMELSAKSWRLKNYWTQANLVA